MAAITDYTAARIVQGIATLYGSNAPMSQLVNPLNVIQVDSVNRAGTIIKDFMPLADGTVTALTTNTAETASGSQGVVPVSFTMYEYGKGSDSVKFPWANFIARAEAPNAYVQVVEDEQNLWTEYRQLAAEHANFALRKATSPDQIYPVLRNLFRKQGAGTWA